MVYSVYEGQNFTELLAYLQYARSFPDAPKNLTPPGLLDPNYVPPDRGQSVIITSMLFTSLAVVFVIARLVARRTGKSNTFGLDDWLCIPATILLVAFAVTQVIVVKFGCVGRHDYDCRPHQLRYAFRFEYISVMLNVFCLSFIKFSILAFIWRLVGNSNRKLARVIEITAVFVLLCLIGVVLTVTFQCKPLAATWELNIRIYDEYKCLPTYKMLTIWSVIFAATDFWLVILPSRTVWHLQIPKATRVGILIIFGLGLVSTIAATVKARTVWKAYDTWDATWHILPLLYSAHVELCLGLIAASLPALNPWLLRILPKRLLGLSSFSGGSSYFRRYVHDEKRVSNETSPDNDSDNHFQPFAEKLPQLSFVIERRTEFEQKLDGSSFELEPVPIERPSTPASSRPTTADSFGLVIQRPP
jgi:hypothetical protein